MNLCHLTRSIPDADNVYIQLLSNTVIIGKDICSNYEPYSFEDDFPGALDLLIKKGLVIVENDYAVLGHKIGKSYRLFSPDDDVDYEKEFEPIRLWALDYANLSAQGKEVRRELNSLLADYKKGATPELLNFFRVCYHVTMQTSMRPFMDKEAGQMKNLLRRFDKPVIMRMIIFMFTQEKGDTINTLTYKADELLTAMRNKGKKHRTRKIIEDDEF